MLEEFNKTADDFLEKLNILETLIEKIYGRK
jgi:hypothetical protein